MFKREVKPLNDLLLRSLRVHGLETPLLQRRLIASWPEVAGEGVASCTTDVRIYNQTLHVRLRVPALRSELGMRRGELVRLLNERVGAQIISDIRFG